MEEGRAQWSTSFRKSQNSPASTSDFWRVRGASPMLRFFLKVERGPNMVAGSGWGTRGVGGGEQACVRLHAVCRSRVPAPAAPLPPAHAKQNSGASVDVCATPAPPLAPLQSPESCARARGRGEQELGGHSRCLYCRGELVYAACWPNCSARWTQACATRGGRAARKASRVGGKVWRVHSGECNAQRGAHVPECF